MHLSEDHFVFFSDKDYAQSKWFGSSYPFISKEANWKKVAERALFLWNNDHIENLIRQNRKVILPIIFAALERNTRGHWNQAVQSLTLNVCKIFSDHDAELFQECVHKFEENEANEKEIRSKSEATWKRLEEIAVSKASSNEAISVPPLAPQQVATR